MFAHTKSPTSHNVTTQLVKFSILLMCIGLCASIHAQNLKGSQTLSVGSARVAREVPRDPSSYAASRQDVPSQLGAGDQITITVFGQPDMSAEVTVGENGTITVPLVGTLNVLNLTSVQLQTLIANRLKEGGYLQEPGVSVQVRQVRSQMISVLGEVQRPGRFPLTGRMTALEAIAGAGGLTERAERAVLLLRRPAGSKNLLDDRQEISIRFDDPSGKRLGTLDAALQNEDVVFVGRYKQFFVHGEVRRAGAFPMEVGMTVMKALALSGGVSERGSMNRIKVFRRDERDVLQEIKADQFMMIQPEDVIYVDERLF